MTIFQPKMVFLFANSRFTVLNDGTYLPRITRETCIAIKTNKLCYIQKPKIECKRYSYLLS